MIKLWVCSKEYPIRFFNGQKWVVGGRGGGGFKTQFLTTGRLQLPKLIGLE